MLSAQALPSWVQKHLEQLGIDPEGVRTAVLDAEEQWLILETEQTLLNSDRNGVSDLYRLDLLSEQLSLISSTEQGQAGNGPSRYPAADASGELIVFHSEADDLVAGDTNQVSDIFLHDWALGSTERLTDAEGASAHPGIDARGSDVVYDQQGADGQRIIRSSHVMGVGEGAILSLAAGDSDSPLDNHHPAISADGRFIAYLEQSETQ
ncbi:TolB family protein, partial [Lamprobacter modestohalophilus]|uniref:TolB family protein n=1 Tax=Lamprobacter modestohalophilus TaxID=1064514 RepID=UPI002ADEDF92